MDHHIPYFSPQQLLDRIKWSLIRLMEDRKMKNRQPSMFHRVLIKGRISLGITAWLLHLRQKVQFVDIKLKFENK
jgi:hypothetical protein